MSVKSSEKRKFQTVSGKLLIWQRLVEMKIAEGEKGVNR
jgi:hypothetical protein